MWKVSDGEEDESKARKENETTCPLLEKMGRGRKEREYGCELYSNDKERHTEAKNVLELPILNTLPMYNR